MGLVNRQRKEMNKIPFPIHPKAYEPLDTKHEELTGRRGMPTWDTEKAANQLIKDWQNEIDWQNHIDEMEGEL